MNTVEIQMRDMRTPLPPKRASFDLKPIETQRSVVETKTFTTPLESVGCNIVYLNLELKVLAKLGVIKSRSASFLIVSADTYLVQLNHYPGVYIHLL